MHSRFLVACCLAIACQASSPQPASVLLFTGKGTSPGDVAAVETILRDSRLSYATADSRQLDAMTPAQLGSYRLLIVPGGDFEKIGKGLTSATATTIRTAVNGGMNFLGICAGAFFAGDSPYNGLNLTSGVRFPFYAAEFRGVRKAAVRVSIAGASTMEHYWEDGPQLSGWGDVVAKYDDGTPAVVQGQFGRGAVMLWGTHPEAPDGWRKGLAFTDPGTPSRAYAATLIAAALGATPLEHF